MLVLLSFSGQADVCAHVPRLVADFTIAPGMRPATRFSDARVLDASIRPVGV
jgi:hypothetical protein